jgi:hypothetical protein
MQKLILTACALALSTTLAFAAEPMAKEGDAMGDTTKMQAPPKSGDDAMMGDAMKGDDKMGGDHAMKPDDKMQPDDKMKPDDKMMNDDNKMGK